MQLINYKTMAGGKRFAGDFQRIDAVKPNDKMLIQDSADGNVKFAFPAQITTINGWKTVESVEELPLNPMRKDIAYVVGDDMYFWVGTGGDTLGGVYQKANIFKGGDGETPHIHFAYANSADGYNDFSMTESANRAYMGIYADYAEEGSTDPTRYTWVRIQGVQGTPSYVHVAYAESADGSVGFSLTDSLNKPYLGIYVDSTKGALDDPAVYKWTLIKGSQGLASYVHIAYANSADGEQDFSTTTATGRSYLGTYASTDPQTSTNPSDYTWMLTKGEQGEAGGGQSGALRKITQQVSDSIVTLQPNAFHIWEGYVSELTLTFAEGEAGYMPIYAVQFSTADVASWSVAGVNWIGTGEAPTLEPYTTYYAYFINGNAFFNKVGTVQYITLQATYNYNGNTTLLGYGVELSDIYAMRINGNRVQPTKTYTLTGYTTVEFDMKPQINNGLFRTGVSGSPAVDLRALTTLHGKPVCGEDMSEMFDYCRNLTTLDLSAWDVSNVTNMSEMFANCNALTTLNMDSWDVSSVTNMSKMFQNCKALTTLNVASWDVSSVTDMSYMFAICNKLITLNVASWDVSSVTDMSYMFNSCYVLTTLNMDSWDVASVTNMSYMFQNCKALTTLDLSAWDVANVTNMSYMFSYCTALTALNMGGSALNPNVNVGSFMAGASTTGVFTYKNIFDYSPIINVLPANWTVTAVAAREITFYVGGDEFVAREGMTWYDWCNSGEFSTEGGDGWSSYSIGCNGADDVVYWEDTSGFGGGDTIAIGGVPVYGRDIIVENGEYNR